MKLNNNICNISLVTNVILNNFRNYEYCKVSLKKNNVLFGNNGCGKTNFLEALSLLSPGRGLRSSYFEDLLNINNNNLRADITIHNSLGANTISILNESTPEYNFPNKLSIKKIFLLDNTPLKKLQNLLFYIKPIWLTPKMDTLFLEDNKIQRNFFDRLIFNFDPVHLTRINSYNKALKERNYLLKIKSKNNSWFTALENLLATYAVAIAASRIDFIDKLNLFIKNKTSTYFSQIILTTDGLIENILLKENISALNCEYLIKEKLQSSRDEDYKTGSTSIGIHKSNINVLNLKNNLFAKSCSTGEQKIMLITIIISFVKLIISESDNNILLLLDEILVHLDKDVRNTLLNELLNLPLQFIITSTDIDHFFNFRNQINFLEVKDNNIFSY